MVVESYNSFIGKNIDKSIIDEILSLNDSEEFKSNGLSVSYEERPKKSFIAKIRDFKNDKVENFTVSYKDEWRRIKRRIYWFSIVKSKLDEFTFTYRFLDMHGSIFQDNEKISQQLTQTIKSRIISKHEVAIFKYESDKLEKKREMDQKFARAERIRKQEEDLKKARQAELDRLNKLSAEFEKKFNTQFFEDHFANVFDICDSHQIGAIKFGHDIKIYLNFKTSPLKFNHSIQRKSGGYERYDDWFGKSDDKMADVVSELSVCSNRIEEYGLSCYYGFTDNGIQVVIRNLNQNQTSSIVTRDYLNYLEAL